MIREIKIEGSELNRETVLWKYMDLSKFVSLLTTKSFWLARADTFRDESEGKFHLKLQETLEKAYAKLVLKDDDKIKDAKTFQKYLIRNAYINCWHENDHENMVMWEIYSQSKEAVAIKTTVGQLIKALDISRYKNNEYIEFILSKVNYAPSEETQDKLKYSDPFFIKRPHFVHESEVRLFLSSYTGIEPTLNTPKGRAIPFNLSEGISEILTHPDAQEWFVKSVQKLVKEFGFSINVKKGTCGNTA